MVIIEGMYLRTGNRLYRVAAQFWTKIFALTFAIGVATGIVMEFEFGTNWAAYSRYVGDVFGSALAAEGVFAFFLESGFLALLLFGWDRISARLHFFATLMVALGAHFSAIWIVVANSWMQTPAGYHIVGEGMHARAEIVDFWAMARGGIFSHQHIGLLSAARAPRSLRLAVAQSRPSRRYRECHLTSHQR
jgi:cytochrome d ubiquinol oxidase subunit I